MYSTKSFCSIFAFASNEPGVTSPIGELTTYAETFTKELGIYHHSTIDVYDLMNFSSISDGVRKVMTPVSVDQAIALVDHVVKMTLGVSGQLYYDEVLLALKTKAESLQAISIDIGAMVSDGKHWVPEWISWSDASSNAGDNIHKVWLAINSFKVQYTDYEIVVVPPFDDLDSFFNPGSIVEARIKAITPSQMMERAETAKYGNPETLTRIDPYEYRDPINVSRHFDVYWTVLIYGSAGNDPDIIRDTLVDYILNHSTHSRDEWAVIFPDIFKRTEFVFAPFWNNYAAEQRVFDYGIYSPIINSNSPIDWLVNQAYGYARDHISDVSQVMSFPYRSLQIAVVGNIENRDGKVKITDYYSDFINVDTRSTDSGRMSIPTQEWVATMLDLVKTAENMDASTDMPRGMYRVTRGNKTYVGKTHNRILMLVVAKYIATKTEY